MKMEKDETRKRKAHTKSRKGCANCKLRRVKCDEGKPQCEKCVQYGVQCSYEACTTGGGGDDDDEEARNAHSLQLPGEGSFKFASEPPLSTKPDDPPPRDSVSPEQTQSALGVIEAMRHSVLLLHESEEQYVLTDEDVETLKRFHYRTIFTIGTAQTVGIYREKMMGLATHSSCLTHIVLALTLMHDRYLSEPWSAPPKAKETFHIYHGTAVFNQMLSRPIRPEDRDPLWGTTALLGCITIASMEATRPEEAWPLKPDDPSDLDWLRMSDGKKEVWRLVDPLRPDSVFREALSAERQRDPVPYCHPVPELEQLYPYLTKMWAYDAQSAAAAGGDPADPYHTATSILVRLLEIECNHSTIMYFLSFLGHMDPRFRDLLRGKDPKALLLLVWWYAKMGQYSVWWQSRRMRLEGQAICLYLERDHADNDDVITLLEYPKLMTGLQTR